MHDDERGRGQAAPLPKVGRHFRDSAGGDRREETPRLDKAVAAEEHPRGQDAKLNDREPCQPQRDRPTNPRPIQAEQLFAGQRQPVQRPPRR